MKPEERFRKLFPNRICENELSIVPGTHPHNEPIIRIYLVPKEYEIGDEHSNPDCLLVFGWNEPPGTGPTRSHGWIHKGPWEEDVENLCRQIEEKDKWKERMAKLNLKSDDKEWDRQRKIMANYRKEEPYYN